MHPRLETWEEDTERFRRNLNLRIHWGSRSNDEVRKSLISSIIKSDWQPPDYIGPENTSWKSFKETAAAAFKRKPARPNIHPRTRKAWKELTTHEDFYVIKADKGGKTVMWRKSDYKKEALRQLEDTNTYQPLSEDELNMALTDVASLKKQLIKRLNTGGHITASESKRLLDEAFTAPSVYFLPKIHKDKRPDTGTFAGRPIIAAIGSVLKTLDAYIAKLTSSLLPLIPGSLQDTRALLRDVAALKDLPKEAILFSADVESLYPSIPWEEGIRAATRFYASRFHVLLKEAETNKTLPPPKPKLFRDILKLVLTKNFFHFQNSSWYHQKSGTAMGCSISVFFANAFLFYRTEHLLKNPPAGLKYLGRYIDDIVGVWTGKPEQIPALFDDVVDQHIKLTYVIGGERLESLDLELSRTSDGRIGTKIFRKPTDGHQYLHWKSAHPTHLKRSIPFAQLLRLKRNCSNPWDYENGRGPLLDRFRKRGYPAAVLERAALRADLRNRSSLISPKTAQTRKVNHQTSDDSNGRLTVVTDFIDSPTTYSIKSCIRNVYERLRKDPLLTERAAYYGDLIPETSPRIAFRSGRTLGSTLGPVYKKGNRPEQV